MADPMTWLVVASIATGAGGLGHSIYQSKKMPKPQAPPPPQSYYGQEGAQVWDAAKNGYVWQPSAASAKKTSEREALRSQILGELSGITSATYEPQQKMFKEEFLKSAQPSLENALIGRGLGGSTMYKESLTDLITNAATQSLMYGQDLQSNQRNYLTNLLSSVNQGLDASTARSLQASQIPVSADQTRQSAQQQAYLNKMGSWGAKSDMMNQGIGGLMNNLSMMALMSGMNPGKTSSGSTSSRTPISNFWANTPSVNRYAGGWN